jgi:hypothetical protein
MLFEFKKTATLERFVIRVCALPSFFPRLVAVVPILYRFALRLCAAMRRRFFSFLMQRWRLPAVRFVLPLPSQNRLACMSGKVGNGGVLAANSLAPIANAIVVAARKVLIY